MVPYVAHRVGGSNPPGVIMKNIEGKELRMVNRNGKATIIEYEKVVKTIKENDNEFTMKGLWKRLKSEGMG